MSDDTDYALSGEDIQKTIPLPDLDYRPEFPKTYRPKVGLIGCGGISSHHLQAYQQEGLEVVALCDIQESAALARQKAFYPEATVYTDYTELLKREDVEVVDIALHPEPRFPVVEAALQAGKHVLSQKPFVLDISAGGTLVDLAAKHRRKLAINQNGRWAPYVRYATQALRAGLIGDAQSISMRLTWDHTWIKGTPFEKIHHILLYDFAIHWFDMIQLYLGEQEPESVYATVRSAPNQPIKPPLMGSAIVQCPNCIATLHLDGAANKAVNEESLTIIGTKGYLKAEGKICAAHNITLMAEEGLAKGELTEGNWFPDGFRGTMGELLCAVEEDREPENNAEANLRSLGLAFAAIHSADTGEAVKPGSILTVGDTCRIQQ